MTKKQLILKLYNDKKLWKPPSYATIAKLVGCTKTYVYSIIKKGI